MGEHNSTSSGEWEGASGSVVLPASLVAPLMPETDAHSSSRPLQLGAAHLLRPPQRASAVDDQPSGEPMRSRRSDSSPQHEGWHEHLADQPSASVGVLDEAAAQQVEQVQQSPITALTGSHSHDPEYVRLLNRLVARRRRRARLRSCLVVLDVALSLLSLAATQQVAHGLSGSSIWPIAFLHASTRQVDVAALAILVLLIWPFALSAKGVYRPNWAREHAAFNVIIAVAVAGVMAAGVLYFFDRSLSTTFLLSFFSVNAAVLAFSRLVLKPLPALLSLRTRVLLVGTGRVALEVAVATMNRRGESTDLIGVAGTIEAPEDTGLGSEDRQDIVYRSWITRRLGDIRDTPRIVQDKEIDLVLVALSAQERSETSWVVSSLAPLPVQVYVVPDVVTETAKTRTVVFGGVPFVGLTESAIPGWTAWLKRSMDLMIGVPALVLTAPIMCAIAFAIRFDSRGPVLFRQVRVGQYNRRFVMYKFRTMYADGDPKSPDAAGLAGPTVAHKRRGDPRITRVGSYLRRTSLDELPQLLNILKGDMSLVGPRPELPEIVEGYRSWQYRRLLVPQGLTGWWQVHGRSERIMHLHTQDDIYYVRNFSLWLDIKILMLTIRTVLTQRGAF